MSIGAIPQHAPMSTNEVELYQSTGGMRHHLSGSSNSPQLYNSMGQIPTAPPPVPFGYQEYGTPYWTPQNNTGGNAGGGVGSAPSSAGLMGVFNLPFTPSDASSPTGTFHYGSTLDNNLTGPGYDTAYHHHQQQQHHQTAADIYATGQTGYGLSQPPPPRRRGGGGFGGQAEYDNRGWSPHAGHASIDNGMTTLGGGAGSGGGDGRLTDPATAPYYGMGGPGGPGYVMSQGMYGDRRKQVGCSSAFLSKIRTEECRIEKMGVDLVMAVATIDNSMTMLLRTDRSLHLCPRHRSRPIIQPMPHLTVCLSSTACTLTTCLTHGELVTTPLTIAENTSRGPASLTNSG